MLIVVTPPSNTRWHLKVFVVEEGMLWGINHKLPMHVCCECLKIYITPSIMLNSAANKDVVKEV